MGDSAPYTFFGRVHPERTTFGFSEAFEMESWGVGGTVNLEVFLFGAQVIIEARPQGDPEIATLRNQVERAVSSLTDSMSFLLGRYLNVEISAVMAPDGRKRVFGVQLDYISEKLTQEEVHEEWLPKVLEANGSVAGPYLQRCLRDYRLAMEHPEDTGFYCFRAVESLRQVFTGEDVGKQESWEKLREVVDIERETIEESIQRYSKDRRHGDKFEITAEERQESLETTWDVIAAFIMNIDEVESEIDVQDPNLEG